MAKELMQKGSFNLHKWRTNATDLQKRIDGVENHQGSVQNHSEAKILGLKWDMEQDNLVSSNSVHTFGHPPPLHITCYG